MRVKVEEKLQDRGRRKKKKLEARDARRFLTTGGSESPALDLGSGRKNLSAGRWK